MRKKIIAGTFLLIPFLIGCAEEAPSEPAAEHEAVIAETEADPKGTSPEAQARTDQVMIAWCKAKSGRDDENCACILGAIRAALSPADLAVVAEIAEADLDDGSSEQKVEAAFNEKFGAERMLGVTEAFVASRASAEASCAQADENPSEEDRV